MFSLFHGKRDPYPLQLEALGFSETFVCLSQITWRHVRGDLYLPSFFLFVLRSVLIVAKVVYLLHRVCFFACISEALTGRISVKFVIGDDENLSRTQFG